MKEKYLRIGNSLSIHWYSVRDKYNEDLEYKNTKIIDFNIL